MRSKAFRMVTAAAAAVVGIVVLAPGASAGTGYDGDRSQFGFGLSITSLTGDEEVPGPGDPDGRGLAVVVVTGERVCTTVSVRGIESATAAHIHRGAAGTAGPVVVHLKTPARGASRSCTTVEHALARDIRQHPSEFYVNVHNTPYPAGAVRGQLD